MPCRSCGVDLPRDAVYCLRCGARVELGSVLGVGTDLPPFPPRNQPAPAPEPVPVTEPAPHEDLTKTSVLPRLQVPAAAGPRQQPTPATPAAPIPPTPPVGGDTSGGSGHSRGSVIAMVATFVLLTIIGTFALTRILGSDDPAPTAVAPSVTSEEGEPSPSDSAAAPSTSPSATPETSPSPSTSAAFVPAGARPCSTSGSDSVATAYAATDRTSCEFAAAVQEAYRKAGAPDGATTLRAFSPVTKKWYSLSCDGGAPVRCTSTTNAVVLLGP
ncbi:hypothetical protein ACOCJ7_03430 [Knoellia sp. CPCC 206453]|uniref:hypothetical protein n=1 Tax=Knoellia pratensis TaxID=3404796 RepID=UPI00361A9711